MNFLRLVSQKLLYQVFLKNPSELCSRHYFLTNPLIVLGIFPISQNWKVELSKMCFDNVMSLLWIHQLHLNTRLRIFTLQKKHLTFSYQECSIISVAILHEVIAISLPEIFMLEPILSSPWRSLAWSGLEWCHCSRSEEDSQWLHWKWISLVLQGSNLTTACQCEWRVGTNGITTVRIMMELTDPSQRYQYLIRDSDV